MEVLEGRGGLQATGVDIVVDVAWRPRALWQQQGWGEEREGGRGEESRTAAWIWG